MKTYKNFVEFVHQRQFIIWECVLSELRTAGFKRWQIWLYQRCMNADWTRFRAALRRAGRVIWRCMIAAGAFFMFQRIDKLIETTTYKNQTIIARNALYACEQMSEICPSVAKLVEKAMK